MKDRGITASSTNTSSEDLTLASPHGPPVSGEERTFAPGKLLSERFRIVRFIAQGGMGQVYEAEDLELRQRVALKTIRPALVCNRGAMERFRREIQLSRRITHPNVCRVFDLFRHVDAPTGASCVFLTMELLEGETLAARLARQKRVSEQEGRAIAEQILAALEAAHAAGVVHRDLKPQNVMLVTSAQGTRAVVTDFGLAREHAAEASATRATETDFVVGTVAYMAPEQLEGKDASTSSDIYALGLVLYEMLTGVPPFAGESPVAVAANRLHQAPSSPRVHVPELSGPWEKTILRCLERDPSRRFASPRQVLRSLDRAVAPTRRPMRAVAVVGSAILFGALVSVFPTRTGRVPTKASMVIDATAPRPSVAIFGFENLTGRAEASWLSTALSEMLATELTVTEKLRVLPGELVGRTKVNLSLDEAQSYAPDTLAHIRQHLGTDYVVLGSYVVIGSSESERIRVDLRVQDTKRGETLASVAEVGSEAELFELVASAGANLRERMGADVRLRGGRVAPVARSARSVEAAKLYAIGVARWHAYDYRGAREALEQAVALHESPRAQAALAELLEELGHRAPALKAAERAVALSHVLPREDRLVIEARYRLLRNETRAAAQLLESLVSLFPDAADHRLALALALADDGRIDEAFAALEPLLETGADPSVALTESLVARRASDPVRQLASARRAAVRARAIGDKLSLAEARIQEASLSPELVNRGEALKALDEARRIYRDVGDRLGEATALQLMAAVQSPDEAHAGSEASALFREVGAAAEAR